MSTSQRASSRAAILAAARRLLAENGTAITLEDVAKAANVSRQAIYLHFANRNELVIAVADDARERAGMPGLAQTLDDAPTPRALLERFARIMAEFHPSTAAAQLGMEALCRTDAELATAWQKRPAGRLIAAQRAVARLDRAGALQVARERAVDLLWSLTGPSFYDQLVASRAWSVRAYERELGRLLLATLIHPSRTEYALADRLEQRKGSTHANDDGDGEERPRKTGSRVESSRRKGVRRGVHG